MLAATLLVKKRDGHRLSDDEIRFLIEGYCSGEIADYQMSALAMAICLRGMDNRETATLTRAMLESGDRLPRPSDEQEAEVGRDQLRPRVDKHSTGGLGDKVSLVLAPLLAACDVEVPMISGRGLGLTGGTLDKLEAIEGFRTQLSTEESSRVLRQVGAFIIGASERIAPADRKLYALRDVTGTVESIPLITASILSKKLAASLDALVMDVKVGSAAFMKTRSQATELAESLVQVGKQAGLPTTAILSDMDQPLGNAVGNAIEVNESLSILEGQAGPVRELTLELCAELLVQVGVAAGMEQARSRLIRALDSGQAMERFERMVAAQGGRLRKRLPVAGAHPVVASASGYLARFDCRALGETMVAMGGGRRVVTDSIDHRVGMFVHNHIGDEIEKGQPILTLHCPAADAVDYVSGLTSAVDIVERPVERRPLIMDRIGVT